MGGRVDEVGKVDEIGKVDEVGDVGKVGMRMIKTWRIAPERATTIFFTPCIVQVRMTWGDRPPNGRTC